MICWTTRTRTTRSNSVSSHTILSFQAAYHSQRAAIAVPRIRTIKEASLRAVMDSLKADTAALLLLPSSKDTANLLSLLDG
jgi:hypothetical protein